MLLAEKRDPLSVIIRISSIYRLLYTGAEDASSDVPYTSTVAIIEPPDKVTLMRSCDTPSSVAYDDFIADFRLFC